MARIPASEIERLKGEIAVAKLATAKGVALRRHGADLIGLCPFHDDREPSLVISPEKNLWHCLGACQAGGSAIDWVMRAESVSFRHAVELLRRDHPSLTGAAPAAPRRPAEPRLARLASSDTDDRALLDRVVSYYHASLLESPEALAYLESRGLRNEEAIKHFRLGFSNRTLGYRLPTRMSVEGGAIRTRLEALGVRRESGHEHFNGSLVVPLLDADGAVVGMYGRKVTASLRKGTPLHLYLPGPRRGIWNLDGIGEEVILCEAILDALTFWCAGFRNVTTAYGVEGFTDELREAFRARGVRRVLIAYDRDEAGDRAAEVLSRELSDEGIETLRVQFPKGMDANAYARKVTPAAESLGLVVRQAAWMAKGKTVVRVAAPVALVEVIAPLPSSPPSPPSPPSPSVEALPIAAEMIAPGALPSFAAEAAPTVAPPRPALVKLPPAPAVPSPPPAPLAAPVAPSPAVGPAAAAASAPAAVVFEEGAGDELVAHLGDRRWRIRGFGGNTSFQQMRVNVLVARAGATFVDTLDLYSARQRGAFVRQAREEVGVDELLIKRDVGELLVALEAKQDAALREKLKPKETVKTLSEEERASALELLRDPHLLTRITEDFVRAGVVGEARNLLVGYLAATSRKLEEPLAIVIQSSSAAGKSSLMDAVLAMMPEEERVAYSAMTGQSLYYMGENDLKHRVLAVVEEEGAERASYALKLLQSEGELTIASTGKDPVSGKLVTHAYRVEGPVALLLTTTAIEIDEELLNRCLVLTVDEGREQTRAIHARQRSAETLAGLLGRRERAHVLRLHQNAQRLLRPLEVVNPYAEELRFFDAKTRTRRDHKKYLALIRAVALLHQHQRPIKEATTPDGEIVSYVEATREDVRVGTELAQEVLGRGLDELPPQTRRLLGLLEALVAERAKVDGRDAAHVRFTRREVREATGWGNTQLTVHLARLVELEYVLAHRANRGESHLYELCLGAAYDGEVVGSAGGVGAKEGAVGGVTGGNRNALSQANSAGETGGVGAFAKPPPGTHTNGASSYGSVLPSFAARVVARAAGDA